MINHALNPNRDTIKSLDEKWWPEIRQTMPVDLLPASHKMNETLPQGSKMDTLLPDLPSGAALEREIAQIEARTHDDRIRITILDRVAMTNDPASVFISNDDVFAKSRARLMAKTGIA